MTNLTNLMQAIRGVWLLEPNTLSNWLRIFDMKINSEKGFEDLINFTSSTNNKFREEWKVQEKRGVAYLMVKGTLTPRTGGMTPYCGMTPTYGIYDLIEDLEEDPSIHTLILHFDSGGGYLIGIPELGERIRNSKLNTIGYTDTMSCSASYWLQSQCDQVIAAPSAQVGSIGVYIAVTKMNSEKDNYYTTHYFSAGSKKLYGAHDIPLTEAEKTEFQTSASQSYNWFCEAVANTRPMSLEEVKATEAGVFKAKDVVGTLVDKTMTLNELLEGEDDA